MSYIVPRDKPSRCYKCSFMDKITYDCKLMYGDDYPDFESQYENCPLIEIKEPHGDLIEVNELLEKAYWNYDKDIEDYDSIKVINVDDVLDTLVVVKGNCK